MATLGNDWTELGRGSWTGGSPPATLTYIIEAKLDSQSTADNKSNISTRARTIMAGYYINSYNVSMSCTGCSTYSTSGLYQFSTKTVLTGSTSVTHNQDGTASFSMSGACIATGLGINIQTSGSINLPTINRFSVISSFNNFNIESGFSFNFTDYLGGKTLTLTCKMGNTTVLTKTYGSAVGTHDDTIQFTSEQLSTIYNNIGANNKSATFSLTLSTSGIGTSSTKEATGTLSAYSNAPIIVSSTVAETNSKMLQCGVGNSEIVRYLSEKTITSTASAVHGATIASFKVRNGSSGTDYAMSKSADTEYTKTLTNLTANTFVLTVTDSRGFTSTHTINCTIKNYSRPSVEKIDFGRDSEISSSGFVRPSGTYWPSTAGNTTNSVTWTYMISSTSAAQSATMSSSSWSGAASLVSGSLLRENAYTCSVTVTDAFGQSASLTTSIGPAKLSVWIGKETLKAEGFVGTHYLGVFPVGAVYLSTTDTNPSTYFGGTWEQIAQGRALIGAGSLQANTITTWGSVTAGAFNPQVNERGGTYVHDHYMYGYDDNGPRAAIGAVDNDVASLGYSIVAASPYGPTSTKQYALNAASIKPQQDNHTYNHYTPVMGFTRGATHVEPYLAVYVWRRTA